MVNQQFTFAVHIMTMLAFSGEKLDSQRLAASVNTNPVVVRRLLMALHAAGLLTTEAGRNGGARLTRSPEKISLLQIYDAIEPRPIIAINRRRAARHCPVSCQMKNVMTSVATSTDGAVRRHLRAITLQQVLRKVKTSAARSR
ncbi:MAG TPA: Rrf2 family transcriptional regulator [Chthoniobacterales bacterium]|jgi:Rrf2 family protein